MILANIWYDDRIAVIDPFTAEVRKMWNFKRLHKTAKQTLAKEFPGHRPDCLNGIGYDKATEMIYLTGKLWGSMFALKYEPNA
jgi:glutaminyl-peptide cyclotransferase